MFLSPEEKPHFAAKSVFRFTEKFQLSVLLKFHFHLLIIKSPHFISRRLFVKFSFCTLCRSTSVIFDLFYLSEWLQCWVFSRTVLNLSFSLTDLDQQAMLRTQLLRRFATKLISSLEAHLLAIEDETLKVRTRTDPVCASNQRDFD